MQAVAWHEVDEPDRRAGRHRSGQDDLVGLIDAGVIEVGSQLILCALMGIT